MDKYYNDIIISYLNETDETERPDPPEMIEVMH